MVIGSNFWLSSSVYDEGDDLHGRATNFLKTTNWAALKTIASGFRAGIECQLSEKYSLGHFNLVRKIAFDDGVCWVVRLRLPTLQNVFGNREALDVEPGMRSEIATMKFLRQNTTVPVPEVFHHDLNPHNTIGAPYMLLSYIHGNVAAELARTRGCPHSQFGTPEQNATFRQRMAEIQMELASLEFKSIGSIYQEGDHYHVGPEMETGQGPWSDSKDYWSGWASHVYDVAKKDAETEVQEAASFALPTHFTGLIWKYGKQQQRTFGLANRDFGAHNVLVNENFEIIGLIDVDGIMAAPIELLAQFPEFMGLQRPVPGHVETRLFAIERMKKEAPLMEEYVSLLHDAAKRYETRTGRKAADVASWIMSDAACVVTGLRKYAQHQDWVNDAWMAAYKRLLEKET